MASILDLIDVHEAQLERVWRQLNATWVSVSDELANAESRLAHPLPGEDAYLGALRTQARLQRELLAEFEQRMHEVRSRAAACRVRYA